MLPKEDLSEATQKVLQAALRAPRRNTVAPLQSPEEVTERLDTKGYFSQAEAAAPRGSWPKAIQACF